ncbi:MAG: TIM barrel protein [Planctomycetota bacterium]|jgi:sugar phosphate isomerase/epimerase|nr:TIM barrel protein [Planctomycetota bacterium]MDP7254597.1 TIM barrel protein [Planctomycetota bacterium]
MIKLGCNAMLPVARPMPFPDYKDDPRNWEDVEKVTRMIYDLRLDIVDLQPNRGFRSTETAYLRRIKLQCQHYGLPIGFIGVGRGFVGVEEGPDGRVVGVPLPEDELQKRIIEVKEGIDQAAFMGAPMIRHFGGGLPDETPDRDALWQKMIHSFQEVADYAMGKGVLIGLHNHAPAVAPTGDDILRLIRDVNRENLTFILDTGQWRGSPGYRAGESTPEEDIYEFMEQTAPYATYVRAKIYKIHSGREEYIDYERIMAILRKVNFNGNMSIVFEDRENNCSDIEAIELAAKYLRGLLEDH